jgi:hypothetical protein
MITEESFMDLETKLLDEQMGITEQLPLPLDEKKWAVRRRTGGEILLVDNQNQSV